MAAQTLSDKNNAFRNNFFIKLKSNKKLLIISSILSLLGIPVFVIAKIIEFRENEARIQTIDMAYSYYPETSGYYYFLSILSMCILLVVVLVTAFNTFQYMYNKPMVDVIFSLPITVNQRFFSDLLAGMATFSVPFIISAVPSFIINAIGFSACKSWAEFQGEMSSTEFLLRAYVIILFTMIMLYATAVLILSICGSIFESILYTVIFNTIVPIVIAAVYAMIEMCVYGINCADYLADMLMYTTFIGGLAYIGMVTMDVPYTEKIDLIEFYMPLAKWLTVYIIVTFAILCAAYFLYRKRKAEDVAKPFVFRFAYYVIITAVCFCMMCGMFATILSYDGISTCIPWIIMTMIIFFIFDTIQNRGFKKFLVGIPKFIAMTGGSCLVIYSFIATNGFGTAYYVPSADSVKQVSIEYEDRLLVKNTNWDSDATLDEAEDIQLVADIHRNIVDRYKEYYKTHSIFRDDMLNDYNKRILITYTLKSGKKVSREYWAMSDKEALSLQKFANNEQNISNIMKQINTEVEHYQENKNYALLCDKFYNMTLNTKNLDYKKLAECYEKDLRNMDINYISETPKTLAYICSRFAVYDSFSETVSYLNSVGITFAEDDMMRYVTSNASFYSEQIQVFTDTADIIAEDGYISTINGFYSGDYKKGLDSRIKQYYINDAVMEQVINILIHAEPAYKTSDKDAVFILYQNSLYILPSEYRADVEYLEKHGKEVPQESEEYDMPDYYYAY